MKKSVVLIVIALLGFMAVPADAQIKFGVKGGVNVSKASISKDVLATKNVTGFNIGPMVEFRLPIVGIGMDAALLYSQKGFKTQDGVVDKSMKTDYLEIPVNFKWKVGIPLAKFYLAAGPYINFRVAGDKIWEIPGSMGDQLKSKSFGAGLNFGAGVELLSHLQLGFNYGLGLTDDYKTLRVGDIADGTGKSRGWSINAAILF